LRFLQRQQPYLSRDRFDTLSWRFHDQLWERFGQWSLRRLEPAFVVHDETRYDSAEVGISEDEPGASG